MTDSPNQEKYLKYFGHFGQSKNHIKLSRMGAVIMDVNSAFCNNAKTIDDLVDFVIGKILGQLKIKHQLLPWWGE